MKNIFIAAVFLFSQLGYTAEKVHAFRIEDQTFSGLFLTKEEIIHLSDEDKTKYLFSMIALTQIIEGSQRMHMDYDDHVVGKSAEVKTQKSDSAKAEIFKLIFPDAQAWVEKIAIGALKSVAPMLERASAWVTERVAARATAVVAVGEPQMMKDTVAAGMRVAVTKKGAIDAAAKVATENAARLKTAEKTLETAMKSKAKTGVEAAAKEYESAKKVLYGADKERFIEAGGSEKDFTKLVEGSGIKKVFMWASNNKLNALTLGATVYSVDTAMHDATGKGIIAYGTDVAAPAIEAVKGVVGVSVNAAKEFFSGTDISGPALPTTAQLAGGDSKQEKDRSCVYGGVPSVWAEFPSAGLKCTRPAAGSNPNCLRENGKFQCPNYGVKLAEGNIDEKLCIKTEKIDNLTIRCGDTLKKEIEGKKASVDAVQMADKLKANGEVIAALEASDRMKDAGGKTKSINAYCAATSVTQTAECGAIKEVLAVLKTTNVEKIYATRVAAQGVKESSPPCSKDGKTTSSTDSKKTRTPAAAAKPCGDVFTIDL